MSGCILTPRRKKYVLANIMRLTDDDITKFIRLYERTYGTVLELPIAQEYASKLVSLVALCGNATVDTVDGIRDGAAVTSRSSKIGCDDTSE